MTNASIARLLFACCFCAAISVSAAAPAAFDLHECRLHSTSAVGGVTARCGEYAVRENRDDPQSRQIRIHTAVVPALRLAPESDALFILAGGPGQAASDLYLSLAPAFARIRRSRDIVLVDQRGTGRSNRLDCAFPDETELTGSDVDELRTLATACLAALPGDSRFYTTSIAVRDLEEIRAALGYDSISIYAASYGTRVAQHYMRRYPTRVRAAILDGVAPAETALGPEVAIIVQRALDATFARCAADAACAERFPDLDRSFAQLRRELARRPMQLAIADPLTGEPTSVQFGEAQLAAAIRLLSYSDETASILPLLIDDAQSAGRPQALAAQYLMIRRSMEEQLAQGMHFAVVCSEDAPRWARENVSEADLERTYLGASFMKAMAAICGVWPRGPVDADFFEPLRTSAPTLMLSGGADPATPARYAAQAILGYQHAKHLVLEGQGHGQLASGCVPLVAARFIETASVENLDDACVMNISPAPFMLSGTAPAP